MSGQSYENFSLQSQLEERGLEAIKKREEKFQLDNLYDEIEEYRVQAEQELKNLQEELQRVREENQLLMKENEEFEHTRERLNQKKLLLQEQESQNRDELTEFSDRIESLKNEIRAMNESIKDNESKIESLKNQIEICEKDLKGDQSHQSSEKQEILQLTNNLRELNRNLLFNQKEVSGLENLIQQLQDKIQDNKAQEKDQEEEKAIQEKEFREKDVEEGQLNSKINTNREKLQNLNRAVEFMRQKIQATQKKKKGWSIFGLVGSALLGVFTGGIATAAIAVVVSTSSINVLSDYFSSNYQQGLEMALEEKREEEAQMQQNKQDLQNVQSQKRFLQRQIQRITQKVKDLRATIDKLKVEKTSTEKTYSEKKQIGSKLEQDIGSIDERINIKNMSIEQLKDRIQEHKMQIADHQYNCKNQIKEKQSREKELAALEISKNQGEEKKSAVQIQINLNHEEIIKNNKEFAELNGKIEINSRNQKFLGREIDLKHQEINAARNDKENIAQRQHQVSQEIKDSKKQQQTIKRMINDSSRNRNNSAYNNVRR